MEARIDRTGGGKKLVIDPCDQDEVELLDEFGDDGDICEAVLSHESGREELHIEIKHRR